MFDTLLPAHVLKIWRQDYGFTDEEIQDRCRRLHRQWLAIQEGRKPEAGYRECVVCGVVARIEAKGKCSRCYHRDYYHQRKKQNNGRSKY